MKKNMLLELFLTFLKIGAFTFGGGYAMIALIAKEAVEKRKWITEPEFIDLIAIAESTPGPIAVNSATYLGYKLKGFFGAFFATLGVVLPSFVVIVIISFFIEEFRSLEYVNYAFTGISAAVAVLIINAALKLYKSLEKSWFSIILIIIAFLLLIFNVIPTPYIILSGGLIGFISYMIAKKKTVDHI
ncbi:MAG: chromate transporter [Candidatus Izemoplasmatales bacterium]|nr:chromate transporter [Candidatus Izemoplasmatales bacterium]MDD3864852.1 chromate transporter [Candidatus Izemoplasmatales bacterium]